MGLLIFRHGGKPYRVSFEDMVVETPEGVLPPMKFGGKIVICGEVEHPEIVKLVQAPPKYIRERWRFRHLVAALVAAFLGGCAAHRNLIWLWPGIRF
jgi:hypothetical protein